MYGKNKSKRFFPFLLLFPKQDGYYFILKHLKKIMNIVLRVTILAKYFFQKS